MIQLDHENKPGVEKRVEEEEEGRRICITFSRVNAS
jgi:hypothetical protein